MVRILVGTRKGLFIFVAGDERRDWTLEGPHLVGWEIFHAVLDPRDGSIHAATNNPVYGATVHTSTDLGVSWTRAEELGLPEESGLTLEKTWHVEPGREGENGRLWLGGAPGVLFRSDDGGANWEAVESLVNHETRDRWHPGAGGMCCHSIQLDPLSPEQMYVGISAAGVFRSEDGGASWTPANQGTAADFLPDPFPPVGQCVHKVLVHPQQPERLWQQNHCGVYRSDDRGERWERLEGNGLPSGFGFPLALDPRDPTPHSSSLRWGPRTASRPTGVWASTELGMRARAGSWRRTGSPSRRGWPSCAKASPSIASTHSASTSAPKAGQCSSRRTGARAGARRHRSCLQSSRSKPSHGRSPPALAVGDGGRRATALRAGRRNRGGGASRPSDRGPHLRRAR